MSINSFFPISVLAWQTERRVEPFSDLVTRNFYYMQLELRKKWFVFIKLQPYSSADPSPSLPPALCSTPHRAILRITGDGAGVEKESSTNWSKLLKITDCVSIAPPPLISNGVVRSLFQVYSLRFMKVGLHQFGTSGHCNFSPFFCSRTVKLHRDHEWKAFFKSGHKFLIGLRSGLDSVILGHEHYCL